MFGADPQQQQASRETSASEVPTKNRRQRMLLGSCVLLAVIVWFVAPFSNLLPSSRYGRPIESLLVIAGLGALFWRMLQWGDVWTSWRTARATRRKIE
jgi:hypothetical protein